MAFGSSKSKSKTSSLDPHQQAALAAELAASELLMRQFLGGGSIQKNHNYLVEEQQRSAFIPTSPADMSHRSRKSKGLVSAQHAMPPSPTTHVIPSSAMPGMPMDPVYSGHHGHHHPQYVPHHHHAYPRSEPRRRQTSDSSSSSATSLNPSPTSSTFDASYVPYHMSPETQYGTHGVDGHRSTAKGVNLKGRAMALFRGH
ncbi:hypothetical protein EV360DRAFT_78696 [Lentinula raphanica]|nr:hypothetical protein EV360DRAFT_78696 [Lentinula raphanica]